MENFGSWLLQELEKRNWSQSDLVRASGISRGTLSNIISGNRGIGEKSLIAIADALNISPITIFRKTGLLPPGSESVTFEDWQFILSQLSPEDEAELRQIAEIKIERRKKNRELKELKTRKAD